MLTPLSTFLKFDMMLVSFLIASLRLSPPPPALPGVVRHLPLQNTGADNTQAYVYIKRFLVMALEGMPKHKKYTKDVFASDRAWLERVRNHVLETFSWGYSA